MSQDFTHNGHSESATEMGGLSPAVQTLHTRLLDDGAAFRASLPDVSQLTVRVIARLDPSDNHAIGSESVVALEENSPAPSQPIPPALVQSHSRIHRASAVAAMLAIVGMLAALFTTIAPGRFASPPTPTPPSAHKVAGGPWANLRIPDFPYSSATAFGNYIVAPSNPHVVYNIGVHVDTHTDTAHEVFARLDGGQRWVPLSFPLPSLAGAAASGLDQVSIGYRLDVMPSDPQALILTLDVQGTTTCPIAHPVPDTCTEYLYSADGGTQWGSLSLPGPGMLSLWLALDNGTISQPYWNQDGRIYTTLSSPNPGYVPTGVRIVSSADNGASWQYADRDLAANGQLVFEFVPAAHGTTLYAVTQSAATTDVVSRQLWRSDDAGVSWQRIGPMAGHAELIGAVTSIGHAAPVVYRDQQIDPSQLPPNNRTNLNMLINPEVSVDGGRTWTPLPLTGLPLATDGDPYTVGTLSDGSLVVVLPGKAWALRGDNAPATLTFYAWAPGDTTWRRLAPAVSHIYLGNSPVPGWWLIPETSSSPARLCASGDGGDISGTGWGVECTTLT